MTHVSEQESLERTELEQMQLERLQATLNRVYRNVQTYRDLFDSVGVDGLPRPHIPGW